MADDNTTTERLVRIEAALAGLATKADLAGVAKNVEIAALGRQLREMRDELRVTSAIVPRLDHMWPDMIEQLRAMVQQQLGILDGCPPSKSRRHERAARHRGRARSASVGSFVMCRGTCLSFARRP